MSFLLQILLLLTCLLQASPLVAYTCNANTTFSTQPTQKVENEEKEVIQQFTLAEVAGAVSSIVVESSNFSTNNPELTNAINAFNAGVGLIGVKNLLFTGAKGTRNLYANLSASIKPAIQQNQNIRNTLLAYYTNWKVAKTNLGNLDNLPTAEKELITKQEKVWKALGYTDNVSGAGNWVTLESKLISKLSSTIDGTSLNKMIAQMKNAGDDGMKLALRIEKGNLESIDGYTSLIKNASVDNHSIKAVNQALDKADNLVVSGKSKELLRFEDNPSGYDIDLGVKTSPSSSTYSEAYQFKTNTTNLSKSSIQGASSQLYNAPTTKRIIEFKLIDGDNINVIKNSEVLKTEFKFQLYDKGLKPTNNVVIDEFHLLSNTGDRVKVIYQNGDLQFINF